MNSVSRRGGEASSAGRSRTRFVQSWTGKPRKLVQSLTRVLYWSCLQSTRFVVVVVATISCQQQPVLLDKNTTRFHVNTWPVIHYNSLGYSLMEKRLCTEHLGTWFCLNRGSAPLRECSNFYICYGDGCWVKKPILSEKCYWSNEQNSHATPFGPLPPSCSPSRLTF